MKKAIDDCVKALQQHLADRKTGAFFIFSDEGIAYISIRDCEIVFCSYQGIAGAAAVACLVKTLRNNVQIKFVFHPGRVTISDENLPSTEEVLSMLEGSHSLITTGALKKNIVRSQNAANSASRDLETAYLAGVVPNTSNRALMLHCLASNTTRVSQLDSCFNVIDRADTLQTALEYVLDCIPDQQEARCFQEDFQYQYQTSQASSSSPRFGSAA